MIIELSDFELQQVRDFEAQHRIWGDQVRRTERYYAPYNRETYPNIPYPPIPSPSDNVVWGVDMSGFWNGVANWQKAKDTGCQFAIIKAVDGTVLTQNFYENVDGALDAGLVVGAYFWLYRNIRISGRTQANAWWNAVKSLGLKILMIDFEWTWYKGVEDDPDTSDLYGAAIPFEQLSGQKPMIYSAPGYMSSHFNHDVLWKAYPFCEAHYGVLKPAPVAPWGLNGHTMWQITDRWPGGPLGLDPAVSTASDGDLFNGTQEQFNSLYNVVTTPTVYVVKRKLSEVDISLTPKASSLFPDIYPLKPVLQQAQENGWSAAINCGAGFVYTDATHAQINTMGFQSVVVGSSTLYYSRKMITAGQINPDLDTTYLAPWTLLGFDATNIYLVVTKGREEESGMTQMEAARWALSQGITECYLMDSGHSSGIVENNVLLYSEYNEPVPQCLGLKPKSVGGLMNKGTCKTGATANIKNIATGALLHQMIGGEVVYGDYSTLKTDLVNFSHYYNNSGVKVELGALAKVSIGTNLVIVENVTEPVTPPPPPQPSGTVIMKSWQITLNVDGNDYTFNG